MECSASDTSDFLVFVVTNVDERVVDYTSLNVARAVADILERRMSTGCTQLSNIRSVPISRAGFKGRPRGPGHQAPTNKGPPTKPFIFYF